MAFTLNKVYEFNTLSTAILGGFYKNLKVISILSASEAVKFRDIYTLHTTIKPTILGIPDNVSDLSYILFEELDNNKNKLLLAIEYIDSFSINELVTVNIRVDILNSDITTIDMIRTRFSELGIVNFKISTF